MSHYINYSREDAMSNKRKKPTRDTKNTYRLSRIVNYLISEGYVNVDPRKDHQRWVDCTGHGRDICFYVSEITKDTYIIDRDLQRIGGYGKDGYFTIQNPRTKRLCAEASTVKEAVKRSRHNTGVM